MIPPPDKERRCPYFIPRGSCNHHGAWILVHFEGIRLREAGVEIRRRMQRGYVDSKGGQETVKWIHKSVIWVVMAHLIWLAVGCATTEKNAGLEGSPADPKGSPRCLLDPDTGPCKAIFEKYYYDRKAGKCRPFIYGGCEGTVPFETLEECREACEAGK